MINRELLGLMKPTAWLINAARGPLVDEAALIEALSSGKLEAAGLDVQLHEPPDPANPLLKLPNVVLSPHNAAAPLECNEKMSIRAAKNMLELFDGVLDPGYVVNPETLPQSTQRPERRFHHQARQTDFSVSHVVIDASDRQILTGGMRGYVSNHSTSLQLRHDVIAFGVRIGISTWVIWKVRMWSRKIRCLWCRLRSIGHARRPVVDRCSARKQRFPPCPGHAKAPTPRTARGRACAGCCRSAFESRCPDRVRRDRAC